MGHKCSSLNKTDFNETYVILDDVEIHAIQIREHLTNLSGILQDGSRRLSQMVQGCVAP